MQHSLSSFSAHKPIPYLPSGVCTKADHLSFILMKTGFYCLASLLLFSISSCDLNDTDDNGDFALYFKAAIDGADWAATPQNIGASLNANGVSPLIRLHGDLAGTNEYFIMEFPPLVATDTIISGTGMADAILFHSATGTFYSTSGSLTVHQAGTPTHREYSGVFSGTFYDATNATAITVTNGEFLTQGIF